jgi:hypothetical protein
MSSFIPYQATLGLSFSIVSLALTPFVSYFQRMFSQSLVIVQMVYLFSNVYSSNASLFANRLNVSWLGFMPSILTYCSGSSSYECNNANSITIIITWAAVVILLWLIVRIVSIKKSSASFQPIYNFWKGIFRWTIIPLVYNSFNIFIQSLQNQDYHRNYYASIVVLIFYGLVLIIELIAYKCY